MTRNVKSEKSSTGCSREERLAKGRELFDDLAARDSGIRGFSEALRENSAEPYNRDDTDRAFEAGLGEDVRRLGVIAEHFSYVREPD